jgi:hypothetical protein
MPTLRSTVIVLDLSGDGPCPLMKQTGDSNFERYVSTKSREPLLSLYIQEPSKRKNVLLPKELKFELEPDQESNFYS